MPIFSPIKPTSHSKSKVHHTEYIRTENEPDTKGTEPAAPVQPNTPKIL